MLGRKLSLPDAAAIAITLAITFFLDRVTLLPRFLLLALAIPQPSFPASNLAVMFFLASAFLFGILDGALAMAASRRLVHSANTASVAVLSASLMLAYALISIPMFSSAGSFITILVDHLPSFLPVYLELCGSLPGWVLGYFFASGFSAQNEIGTITKLVITGLTFLIVAAVYVLPPYVPTNIPRVPDTFHTVPEPQIPTGPVIHILPPPSGQ